MLNDPKVAPEQTHSKKDIKLYNSKSWSTGIVLFVFS